MPEQERESAQAEHDRKEAEREAERQARRARLGHEQPSGSTGPEDPAKETKPGPDQAKETKPGPTGPASTSEDKPPARPRRRSKEHSESEE